MKTTIEKKLKNNKYEEGWFAGFDARELDFQIAIRVTKTRKELIKVLAKQL